MILSYFLRRWISTCSSFLFLFPRVTGVIKVNYYVNKKYPYHISKKFNKYLGNIVIFTLLHIFYYNSSIFLFFSKNLNDLSTISIISIIKNSIQIIHAAKEYFFTKKLYLSKLNRILLEKKCFLIQNYYNI